MNKLRSSSPYPGTWCSPHVSAGGTPAPSLQTLTNKQTLIRSSVCSVHCGFRVCTIASQFAMWIHRDANKHYTHRCKEVCKHCIWEIRFCFLTAIENKPVPEVCYRSITTDQRSEIIPNQCLTYTRLKSNTNLLGRCFKFMSSGWERAYFFSVTTLRLHDAGS